MVSSSSISLSPVDDFDTSAVTMHILPSGAVLERVHKSHFGPTTFNDTSLGNARFSPIRNRSGEIIPTIYAGFTFNVAVMETALSNVPYRPGIKTINETSVTDLVHSTLTTNIDIPLVSLSNKALRKAGVHPQDITQSEKDKYPLTRALAEKIHANVPDAHGLIWVSRQDGDDNAIVLFGDRVSPSALIHCADSRKLLEDAFDDFTAVLDAIGAEMI